MRRKHKPNMSNLHGAVGKSIVNTIRNAQKSDHRELECEVAACKKRILARRAKDNPQIITLYHGSNSMIQKPSILNGRMDNDFGIGFYLTNEIEIATQYATRWCTPVVNEYRLDLDSLNVYTFNDNDEWLEFVVDNQNLKDMDAKYESVDVLIGPDIDKKMQSLIESYEMRLVSADKIYEVLKEDLHMQYVIRSQKAFDQLTFINSIRLAAKL